METQKCLFDSPKKGNFSKKGTKHGPEADALFGYKARLFVSGIIADIIIQRKKKLNSQNIQKQVDENIPCSHSPWK